MGGADVMGFLAQHGAAALVHDALVVIHLIALAIGVGGVIQVDRMMLSALRLPTEPQLIAWLGYMHAWIAGALTVLWLSGIGLFVVRMATGGSVTPKLVAKFLVVSILTLVAFAMGRIFRPMLSREVGRPLLALDLRQKLGLAVCAGLSVGGWSLALLLGGFAALKTAPAGPLLVLLGLGFALPVLGLTLAVLVSHATIRSAEAMHPAE